MNQCVEHLVLKETAVSLLINEKPFPLPKTFFFISIDNVIQQIIEFEYIIRCENNTFSYRWKVHGGFVSCDHGTKMGECVN